MSLQRILFIARDGALLAKPSDQGTDLQGLRLMPDVIPALSALRDAGYQFVVVGPDSAVDLPREHPVDKARSYVVGDQDADMEFARKLGIECIRVHSDRAPGETWSEIARRLAPSLRTAQISRKTKETDIQVEVRLDEETPIRVATGIGFFDHMLEQVAKHGGFSLQLTCAGDLHIDEHHTVEDCALALGQALKTALGDKRGIHRYGFLLPMDEALAQVAIDLSGRPYFVFEGQFGRDQVGELPTELVPHFFRSLAETLGAAINIKVDGENTHHMIEACFKGVGRALRQAIRVTDTQLPSTKGIL